MASESCSPDNRLQVVEVLELLKKYGYSGASLGRASYYDLGLFLGLSPTTLDEITFNNKGDIRSCLRECITKWLQEADDVQKTKGGPIIYSLVSALRKLEENRVANGIDMEMHPACRILACYSSNQSLLSALPQWADLLHSEFTVSRETMLHGEAPLAQVKEAICHDYKKLEAFAEILCKDTATADIGSAIKRDYREAYESDDEIKRNDKNGLKIYLPKNVTAEFKDMRLKFGNTFFEVGSIMKKNPQSPSLNRIKYILRQYDKALRSQVSQCNDIHEILELVGDNCSLDDIGVLEFFIDEFKIEEARPVIEEYKQAIEEFRETKLSQCLKEQFSYASPLECERITIVVDKDVNDSTLNDVKGLSSDVFENSSKYVRLNVIRDGNSFTITCSFPLILSKHLITAALNNIDVLKENKVKRLTIGYFTVYERKKATRATTAKFSIYTNRGARKQLLLSKKINDGDQINDLKSEIKGELSAIKEQFSRNESNEWSAVWKLFIEDQSAYIDISKDVILDACTIMIAKFDNIFCKADELMINVQKFALKVYLKGRSGDDRFALEINECKTNSDILHLVRSRCSLTNIGLMKDLVDRFKIEEVQGLIDNYKASIKKVYEGLPFQSQLQSTSGYATLIIENTKYKSQICELIVGYNNYFDFKLSVIEERKWCQYDDQLE